MFCGGLFVFCVVVVFVYELFGCVVEFVLLLFGCWCECGVVVVVVVFCVS